MFDDIKLPRPAATIPPTEDTPGKLLFTEAQMVDAIKADRATRADSTPTGSGEAVATEMAERLRGIVKCHGDNAVAVHTSLLAQAADECDRFYNGMMALKCTAEKKDRDWDLTCSEQALEIEHLKEQSATPADRAAPSARTPDLDLLKRCLSAMKHAVAYGETGRGRPPQQTCMFEIEELEAILAAATPTEQREGEAAMRAPNGKEAIEILRRAMTLAGIQDVVRGMLTLHFSNEWNKSLPLPACTVPPPGWYCTRTHGHDGPCAALASSSAPCEGEANNYHDAYRGAREDLMEWKKRALEAEESCRRMIAALNAENGPTFMGEPVIAAQPAEAAVQTRIRNEEIDRQMAIVDAHRHKKLERRLQAVPVEVERRAGGDRRVNDIKD